MKHLKIAGSKDAILPKEKWLSPHCISMEAFEQLGAESDENDD